MCLNEGAVDWLHQHKWGESLKLSVIRPSLSREQGVHESWKRWNMWKHFSNQETVEL